MVCGGGSRRFGWRGRGVTCGERVPFPSRHASGRGQEIEFSHEMACFGEFWVVFFPSPHQKNMLNFLPEVVIWRTLKIISIYSVCWRFTFRWGCFVPLSCCVWGQMSPLASLSYVNGPLLFHPVGILKYCNSTSVYRSVCSHNLKTAQPNFTKFFMHVASGHGLILLWRHCGTLCTSGFMNVVIVMPLSTTLCLSEVPTWQ